MNHDVLGLLDKQQINSMATGIYRYRTHQYIGPVMDQYIYNTPFLFTEGQVTEPVNVQWVTDPSVTCTAEQKRLSVRKGERPIVEQPAKPVIQYRPFM